MRRAAVALIVVALLATTGARPAAATSPSPPAAPSPSATVTPSPSVIRARLGRSLAEAVAAQGQLSRALRQNAAQRESVRRQLAATDSRIAELDAAIAAREAQIADLRVRVARERSQVAALARAIDEQPASVLQRLVQTRGLGELLSTVSDLTSAGRRGGALADQLDGDRQSLEREQEQQRAERESQSEMRARQQADLEQLGRLMVEEDRVARALAASLQRTRAELARSPSGDAELADRIAGALLADQQSLVAAAQQAAWDQAALWMEANPDQMASLGPARPPAFAWPVPRATITQGFGPTDLAIEPAGTGYPHFQTGLDLAADLGTPVLAADRGMVAAVDSSTSGYGTYVVIAHAGGLVTLYGHLLQPLVGVGDRVERGQPVGLLGSTGSSTGPHCHFEVRLADHPVDPLPLIQG